MAERAQAWFQRCGKSVCEKGFGPNLDPCDSVRLRTASTHWDVPVNFLFLLEKESMVVGELVVLGPRFSAETGKACSLIGLHMMAEENALR